MRKNRPTWDKNLKLWRDENGLYYSDLRVWELDNPETGDATTKRFCQTIIAWWRSLEVHGPEPIAPLAKSVLGDHWPSPLQSAIINIVIGWGFVALIVTLIYLWFQY